MMRKFLFSAVALAAALMSVPADAAVVSVAFSSATGIGSQTGASVLGTGASDIWNVEEVLIDQNANTVTGISLNDVTGASSGLTLDHFGLRQHNASGQVFNTGNDTPFQSSVYMRHLNDNPTLTISGLTPGETADIALFGDVHLTGQAARGVTFTIGGSSQATTGSGTPTAASLGDNYVLFSGLTVDPSGVIGVALSGAGGNFSDFDGFQISTTPVPEPSSFAMLVALGLAPIARRRRKK